MPLPAALPVLGKIGAAVGPLLAGLFGGKKAKESADKRTAGATLPDLLPLLLPLIQQMQSRSNQTYGMQMDRYQSQMPLQQALSRMAMGLIPNRYGGGNAGQMPMAQGGPPQQPVQPLPLPGMPQGQNPARRRTPKEA